jgi:hypothetical protein
MGLTTSGGDPLRHWLKSIPATRTGPKCRGRRYVPLPSSLGTTPHVLSAPVRLVNCPLTSVRKPDRRVLVLVGDTQPLPIRRGDPSSPACEMDRPN